MPERSCSAARGADRRLEYAAFVVAAGIALGCVAAAAIAVFDWKNAGSASALMLPAAFLLAACGIWQASFLAKDLRRQCWHRVRATYFCVHLWQSLLSGAAVLYLVALCVGPIPGLGWAWLAAVALWQSVLLLPLMASPQVAENWRRWTESHRIGRLNWLVAASVALLATGEGALRLHGLLGRAGTGAESLELARVNGNGDSFDGNANWSTAFDANRGRFCVALLSDAHSTATTLTSLCQRIQQALPGAEVVRLEVSLADSNTAQLSAGLDEIRPDVVLAVLPACREWAPVRAKRSLFDRERFELARAMFGASTAEDSLAAQPNADFESFLNELAPDLAACRTPLDEPMRSRWGRTFAALDGTVDTCRAADVPLALVVLPGELQLNEGLRMTLVRRFGLTPEQVDLDLPQRRLAVYAERRELPLVDLLPHLQLCREALFARHQTQLSDRGNIEAASAIGGWLESRYGGQMAEQLSRNK